MRWIERLRCNPSCARFECDGARVGMRGVSMDGLVENVGEVTVLFVRECVSTAGLK